MPEGNVREMRREDLPQVIPLSGQLGYELTLEDARRRFQLIARDPLPQALLVAEIDGRVVGWLHVQQRRTLESEVAAEILALVVDKEVRRAGVGRALVSKTCDWAKSQGLSRVRVRSNVKRVESHIFYPAVGFELSKTQHVYQLSLRA